MSRRPRVPATKALFSLLILRPRVYAGLHPSGSSPWHPAPLFELADSADDISKGLREREKTAGSFSDTDLFNRMCARPINTPE